MKRLSTDDMTEAWRSIDWRKQTFAFHHLSPAEFVLALMPILNWIQEMQDQWGEHDPQIQI